MDTTSPEANPAPSPEPNRVLLTILAEQRRWMERAEKSRRRHMLWMWITNLALRPITTWVYDRITDLFG
jgi:hypothetical protein